MPACWRAPAPTSWWRARPSSPVALLRTPRTSRASAAPPRASPPEQSIPPMIPRYSRPEMAAIWSPEAKFRIWFDIEAHALDAMAAIGVAPKSAAETVRKKGAGAKFDGARIDEIEREVKH